MELPVQLVTSFTSFHNREKQAETQEPRTGSDSVAVAAEDPAAAPGPGARSPYRCAQMQRAAATPAQTITGSGTA